MTRPLDQYHQKRDFNRTPEPDGHSGAQENAPNRSFVVQKHAATRLHWDFRLEWEGVLLSWAVTRGPSTAPAAKRLSVRTEDHPLDYARFEGTIPKPQYGAGTVMLWDQGTWAPLGDVPHGLAEGMLKFVLSGTRMQGAWMLVRMKPRSSEKRENWLLIKEKDRFVSDDSEALVTTHLTSVTTGRDMDAIARNARPKRPVRAKTAPCPAFHPVQLATLHSTVPHGDDWLHEVKVDGYRCQAAIGQGDIRLYTRSGLDWTTTFGALRPAFETLPCQSALIDGEVVADVDTNAFSVLQSRLEHGGPLAFVAFDLLHLDGRDLTDVPLVARKAALENLLADSDPLIRYATHLAGHGPQAWDSVCAAGREGLVSKRADAPYRAGRHDSWIKLKCTQRQEFVIGGWSPSASKGRPFASLLMGSYEDGRLVYRGRVGTGFDTASFARLMPLLDRRARKTSAFHDAPSDLRGARWVTPDLVAEIRFAELTATGHIRHGSFQALRHDKPACAVGLDKPPPPKGAQKLRGVAITHPDRRIIDAPVVTKLQVAQHYAVVADRMLPFARNRPLSLLRCPDGIAGPCFFQKHRGKGMPSEIGKVAVSNAPEDADYITIASAAGLVAAAQMGTVEFHICGARNAALDLPDRIVFDLDPDEALPFDAVRAAACDLRVRLEDLGLPSVPMLTGGKGIHVIVPLRPQAQWATVTLFSRTLALMMAQDAPDRYTVTMSKARRKGRIFIDWLRNERGATAVAPYALRARTGAGVAVPVSWDALGSIRSAAAFGIYTVQDRLQNPCPLQLATRRAVVLGRKVLHRLDRQIAG